jgi:hypothetical protein
VGGSCERQDQNNVLNVSGLGMRKVIHTHNINTKFIRFPHWDKRLLTALLLLPISICLLC